MVGRPETEKGEQDSLQVGSLARVTTTMSSTDEPVTTESLNLVDPNGSGSADTRPREDSTPRLNNEIFQREDEELQRTPPLPTEFSQPQGPSSDEDELQNLHEEIREEKADDHPTDDNPKLKDSSSK